jgi:xylose isomerase
MGQGGINFDAKLRRNSTDPADLFIAHITGMDIFAKALLVAEQILRESPYKQLRAERYASFDAGDGARFEKGELSLDSLASLAKTEPAKLSGQQERIEQLLTMYC